MISPAAPPLAVGLETLISVAVLLMGVVGWVVQMAQQGKAANAARRQPPPNRQAGGGDEKLRDEIDSFLQEVAGRRGQNQNRNRPAAGPQRRGPVDPFEEPPRRPARRAAAGGGSGDVPDFLRPAAPQPRPSDRRPAARPQPVAAAAPPKKKRQDLRDRKLGRLAKKNLGGELREHVERYMAVEQSDLARQHVQVKDRLSRAERELSDLKNRLADPNDPTQLAGAVGAGQVGPARLRSLLSDPAGVREAIIVNELLAKPLGLRGGAATGRVDPAAAAAGLPGGPA